MNAMLPSDQLILDSGRITGIDPTAIVSAGRDQEVVRVRWAIMRVLRGKGWSTARIGRKLGGRDHTTVMHGLARAAAIYVADADFAWLCDQVAAA